MSIVSSSQLQKSLKSLRSARHPVAISRVVPTSYEKKGGKELLLRVEYRIVSIDIIAKNRNFDTSYRFFFRYRNIELSTYRIDFFDISNHRYIVSNVSIYRTIEISIYLSYTCYVLNALLPSNPWHLPSFFMLTLNEGLDVSNIEIVPITIFVFFLSRVG